MRCMLVVIAGWLLCGSVVVSAQEKTPGAPKTKATPKAAAADAELEAKLDTKMKAEFVDVPLNDVLNFISDLIDVDILIDRSAEDLGLTRDQPVSLTITKREVKARTVLDLVLRKFSSDVDYAFRDGVLIITSTEQSFVTQVYNVGTLVVPRAAGDDAGMSPEEEALLQVIQTTVQPNTWAEVGGPASAKILNGLLVVKHGPKAHTELRELISKLNQARQEELKGG